MRAQLRVIYSLVAKAIYYIVYVPAVTRQQLLQARSMVPIPIHRHDLKLWSSGLADGALIGSIGAPAMLCGSALLRCDRGVGDHEPLPRFLRCPLAA